MYGITKTRMLMTTTTICAAGAALFAGAANARVLMADGDEASGAHPSKVTRVIDSRFSINVSRAGSTRYGYVVGGLLITPEPREEPSSQVAGVADTGVADGRLDVGVPFGYWGQP